MRGGSATNMDSPDKIILSGMTFYGYHGTNPAEKERGQRFVVDVELEADLRRSGETDDLNDTINYADAYRAVREVVEGESRNLLERVASEVAARLLADFPAQAVLIRITKPQPPIKGATGGAAAVEVYRRRAP